MGCSGWHRDRPKRLLDRQGATSFGGSVGNISRSIGAAAAVFGRRLDSLLSGLSLSLSLISGLLMQRRRASSRREQVKHESEHEDDGRRLVEQSCTHIKPTCRDCGTTRYVNVHRSGRQVYLSYNSISGHVYCIVFITAV